MQPSFRSNFEKVKRDLEVEQALANLDKFYFDRNKSMRLLSGIAISSRQHNVNDQAFLAAGVTFSLPVPLMWDHLRPLGRILGIEIRGEKLHWRAEVGNAAPSVDEIWEHVKARNVEMCSVLGENLLDGVIDRTYMRWHLREISLVQLGADAGAVITRCSERSPVVSLHHPSEVVHWSRP